MKAFIDLRNVLPKEKCNGKTIDGFSFRFSFHLLNFRLIPKWGGECNLAIFWLWFTIRFEAHYD